MGLFKKRAKPIIAVVEGAHYGSWDTLGYRRLTDVSVPEGAIFLQDGNDKYVLYGYTEDFKTIKDRSEETDLEAKVETPYKCTLGFQILGTVRTICLKDGRIFVNQLVTERLDYLEKLKYVIEDAGKLFRGESFN